MKNQIFLKMSANTQKT